MFGFELGVGEPWLGLCFGFIQRPMGIDLQASDWMAPEFGRLVDCLPHNLGEKISWIS